MHCNKCDHKRQSHDNQYFYREGVTQRFQVHETQPLLMEKGYVSHQHVEDQPGRQSDIFGQWFLPRPVLVDNENDRKAVSHNDLETKSA